MYAGGAAFYLDDWFYLNWATDCKNFTDAHINTLELKTVLEAIKRWGPQWAGKHILVRCDNSCSVAAINKTTSKSSSIMDLVREMFWLATLYNFKLSAAFIPGKLNVLADRISRLHEFKAARSAYLLLNCHPRGFVNCFAHMSQSTFRLLLQVWRSQTNSICSGRPGPSNKRLLRAQQN